jgi:hypothetical protein
MPSIIFAKPSQAFASIRKRIVSRLFRRNVVVPTSHCVEFSQKEWFPFEFDCDGELLPSMYLGAPPPPPDSVPPPPPPPTQPPLFLMALITEHVTLRKVEEQPAPHTLLMQAIAAKHTLRRVEQSERRVFVPTHTTALRRLIGEDEEEEEEEQDPNFSWSN